MSKRRVIVFDDAAALAEAAAREVARTICNAVARRGVSTLVVAGGRTPRQLYERLAGEPYRETIDWPRVELFWGDERCVAPDHPKSNYRLAEVALLSKIPRGGNAHRIFGEIDPARAATLYEQEIRDASDGGLPRFDLILLGMGADGHTASLFPDTPALLDERRLVVATTSPQPPHHRVTVTLRVINAARKVMFLVTGGEKAATLVKVVRDGSGASAAALPAALVCPRGGRLIWLVDRAAAEGLDQVRPTGTNGPRYMDDQLPTD